MTVCSWSQLDPLAVASVDEADTLRSDRWRRSQKDLFRLCGVRQINESRSRFIATPEESLSSIHSDILGWWRNFLIHYLQQQEHNFHLKNSDDSLTEQLFQENGSEGFDGGGF